MSQISLLISDFRSEDTLREGWVRVQPSFPCIPLPFLCLLCPCCLPCAPIPSPSASPASLPLPLPPLPRPFPLMRGNRARGREGGEKQHRKGGSRVYGSSHKSARASLSSPATSTLPFPLLPTSLPLSPAAFPSPCCLPLFPCHQHPSLPPAASLSSPVTSTLPFPLLPPSLPLPPAAFPSPCCLPLFPCHQHPSLPPAASLSSPVTSALPSFEMGSLTRRRFF